MQRDSTIYSSKNSLSKVCDNHEKWRKTANFLELNEQERLRVEWMIYFVTKAERNAVKTCYHFGISRKTFYKWLNRFTYNKQDINSLRNIPRRPHMVRGWEVSIGQERRIILLRKKYIHYGKKKLKILYSKKYGEEISCWKIERVIRKHKLYPNKEKEKKITAQLSIIWEKPKRCFTWYEKDKDVWFLFLLEIMAITMNTGKQYVLTAVEYDSELGFARMYKNKRSASINDFLFRINHFIQQLLYHRRKNNTSETNQYFPPIIEIPKNRKYFSWLKVAKNELETKRFNKTIESEWLINLNVDSDCSKLNQRLSSWLIEYNFNRPHQSLNYLTPVEHIKKKAAGCYSKNRMTANELTQKIIDYVAKLDVNELETLSVESIARNFGISRIKLWRCFKKAKQINLQKFLFRVKMRQAATLLQSQPHLTVKKVAEKTGFYCYGYFFSIFKEHFGITPGKYKELKKSTIKNLKKKND